MDPKTGRDRTRDVCSFKFLTNILEADGAGGVVKIHAADVQGVQLGYVVPPHLRQRGAQLSMC